MANVVQPTPLLLPLLLMRLKGQVSTPRAEACVLLVCGGEERGTLVRSRLDAQAPPHEPRPAPCCPAAGVEKTSCLPRPQALLVHSRRGALTLQLCQVRAVHFDGRQRLPGQRRPQGNPRKRLSQPGHGLSQPRHRLSQHRRARLLRHEAARRLPLAPDRASVLLLPLLLESYMFLQLLAPSLMLQLGQRVDVLNNRGIGVLCCHVRLPRPGRAGPLVELLGRLVQEVVRLRRLPLRMMLLREGVRPSLLCMLLLLLLRLLPLLLLQKHLLHPPLLHQLLLLVQERRLLADVKLQPLLLRRVGHGGAALGRLYPRGPGEGLGGSALARCDGGCGRGGRRCCQVRVQLLELHRL
mmetsp:Transcript_46138/g.88040  ORF Transcript_46138/g.88040 Transcript_46138/m.88040 type:complete len:353 (+) Transcript_46138:991-2049(+)